MKNHHVQPLEYETLTRISPLLRLLRLKVSVRIVIAIVAAILLLLILGGLYIDIVAPEG